jgi:hypothetical protein
VFREEGWINHRSIINPQRWKEHQLHCVGLGFLNKINLYKEYTEKFMHIDPITEDALKGLHFSTRLFLTRKFMFKGSEYDTEIDLLAKHKFRKVGNWGTLILDLTKDFNLDKPLKKAIKTGERNLTFKKLETDAEYREYYDLYKQGRTDNGLKTPEFKYFLEVRKNPYYHVFIAKKEDRIVAGHGIVHNGDILPTLKTDVFEDRASNGKTNGTQELPSIVPASTTPLAFTECESRGGVSTGVEIPVSPTVSQSKSQLRATSLPPHVTALQEGNKDTNQHIYLNPMAECPVDSATDCNSSPPCPMARKESSCNTTDNYAYEFNLARDKSIYYDSDYLTFKILEYLKSMGIKWYDFAGVNPSPKEGSKDYSIRKYKEKWGGEYYNVYEYIRSIIPEIKLNDTESFHRKCRGIVPPQGKVADVGCGYHKITPEAIGYDIVDGVDKKIGILDIQEKNEYDTVYCIGMFYLLQSEEVIPALHVLKDMLKQGGTLFIATTNPEPLFKSNEYGTSGITKELLSRELPNCRFRTMMWGAYLVGIWQKK